PVASAAKAWASSATLSGGRAGVSGSGVAIDPGLLRERLDDLPRGESFEVTRPQGDDPVALRRDVRPANHGQHRGSSRSRDVQGVAFVTDHAEADLADG